MKANVYPGSVVESVDRSDPKREHYAGTWIDFIESPIPGEARVTRRWLVTTKTGGGLGVVKWFSNWRKYAFFPGEETVFEQDCLREIATFCEKRTRDRKEERKAERQG